MVFMAHLLVPRIWRSRPSWDGIAWCPVSSFFVGRLERGDFSRGMLADTSPESPSLYRIIKPVSGFCFSFFTAPPFFLV